MSAYTGGLQINQPSLLTSRFEYQSGNFIGSDALSQGLDFHEPQVDPVLVRRYGRDDLTGLLTQLPGFSKAITNRREYFHAEKDFIHGLVLGTHTAAASPTGTIILAAGSKNALTYDLSPYQSTTAITSIVPRVDDVLQLPILTPLTAPLEVLVMSVNGSTDFVVSSIDGSDIPTIIATDEIIIKGNIKAEGSVSGKSRMSRTISYKNNTAIHRDAFEVTGSEHGERTWIEYKNSETGQTGNVWYLEGLGDTFQRFRDEVSMMTFDGGQISATSDIPDTAGHETYTKSEGLLTTMRTAGNVQQYTSGGLLLEDLVEMGRKLNKFKGDKINLLLNGYEFQVDFNALFRQGDGVDFGTANAPARLTFSAGSGVEEMAINLDFASAQLNGYKYLMKTVNTFSDPTTYGAVGQNYDTLGMLIPMGNVVVFNDISDKSSSETVPTCRLNYKIEHDGVSRYHKEFVTGSVGGAMTSDEDVMKVHMLAECGLEVFAINRFGLFEV